MKNTIYYFVLTTLFIISCSSKDGDETAIDKNLPEIAEKLKVLKTSHLSIANDNFDSYKNATKKKKAITKNEDDCLHETTYQLSNEGNTHTISRKFFDETGAAITNCDVWELDNISSTYVIEDTETITNNTNKHDLHQHITVSQSIEFLSLTSFKIHKSQESDIEGTLNFDGSIFYFLEGSYWNINQSYLLSEDIFLEDSFENSLPEMELNYSIGFEVNNEDYHFVMLLKTMDLFAIEENSIQEFDLLNSKKQKVGTVLFNNSAGQENYEVLDLNGNKVLVD